VSTPPTYESAPPPPAGSYSSGPSGPRAGFWRRFGGWIIDAIIIGIVDVILLVAFGTAVEYAVGTILALAYGTYFEGSARGQTIGKMAVGVRVYDFQQGGSIGYSRALVRQLVKIVSGLAIAIGYLWMLWDKEKQCWHDKAANDVVVPVSAYS
jgi:uncharacterized RDD family membrane protein YckC